MTINEAIDHYSGVTSENKGRFLVRLSYELTVQMRACYDEADVDLRAMKLHGANEIQHHLAAEAHHHLIGNEKPYPGDVRSCVESAALYEIGGEFRRALTWCFDQFESA